jgi:MFS family permease
MFMAVYVLYMTRDLGLSAMGIGLVFATGGVGSFAGSVVAEPLARRFGPGPTMIGAQVAFGLTGMMVPVAVLVPSWALAMVIASEFAQWMAILIYWVVAISVRQAIVPDRVLGRVNATMLCLPLIRPIGSRRLPEVFVVEPAYARHLYHPALARRQHTPRVRRILGQR